MVYHSMTQITFLHYAAFHDIISEVKANTIYIYKELLLDTKEEVDWHILQHMKQARKFHNCSGTIDEF